MSDSPSTTIAGVAASATTPAPEAHTAPGNGSAGAALRRLGRAVLPWASTAALLGVWWYGSATGRIDPQVLPSPQTVAGAARDLAVSGTLPTSLGVSFLRAAIGALLGLGTGLLLGLLAGLSRFAERAVDKPMQMVRAIPFTALVPLFIIWFGIGELPKILLVTVGVAVPVYINTFAGVRDVDARLVEVARICGLGRRQIALTVLLPGALPSILVGVRFALGIAWVALIVAESLAAGSGIGFVMAGAREFSRTDVMLVCIVLYALLGVLTDLAVRLLERVLLRWRVAFTGD